MNQRIAFALLVATLPSPVFAQQSLDVFPAQFELNGMHEGRQLLVTGPAQRDLTRTATFTVEPGNVVRVSTQGYVRPIGKGTATIRIDSDGQKRDVKVTVKDLDESKPLHFANDIMPILT